jgi:hypothetical protein
MIGNVFNMDSVFMRDLTVCVLDTLEGQINLVNRFTSGNVYVQVPFYYSMTGDERFLLDSFSDDVVSTNRFVELNTDMIPRGHLTMTSFNIKSDEFSNPNVWLKMVVEDDVEVRRVLAKVRAIPISVSYDLVVLISSEIDAFKCSQAIMDTLWLYKFMYFEHNFLNIDAIMILPDTEQIEIVREKSMTSDNQIKLTVSFEVHTYYPALRRDRVGSNETGVSGSKTGPLKETGGVYDPNYIVAPKRTKWFANILRARESSKPQDENSNSGSTPGQSGASLFTNIHYSDKGNNSNTNSSTNTGN